MALTEDGASSGVEIGEVAAAIVTGSVDVGVVAAGRVSGSAGEAGGMVVVSEGVDDGEVSLLGVRVVGDGAGLVGVAASDGAGRVEMSDGVAASGVTGFGCVGSGSGPDAGCMVFT